MLLTLLANFLDLSLFYEFEMLAEDAGPFGLADQAAVGRVTLLDFYEAQLDLVVSSNLRNVVFPH